MKEEFLYNGAFPGYVFNDNSIVIQSKEKETVFFSNLKGIRIEKFPSNDGNGIVKYVRKDGSPGLLYFKDADFERIVEQVNRTRKSIGLKELLIASDPSALGRITNTDVAKATKDYRAKQAAERAEKQGNGCAVLILIAILVAFGLFIGWACSLVQDDGTTYHYYDTNQNDRADDNELKWVEDGDGNTTQLGW